jgi:tetratricopeptide (TPR) repeat protein
MDRIDDALAAFRAEIAAFPHNTDAYARLALLDLALGRRADAERVLRDLLRANPPPAAARVAAEVRGMESGM